MLRLSTLAAAMLLIDEEGRRPPSWLARPSDSDVETVLTHLVPIRTRSALAASYAREGRRLLAGVHGPARSADAVDEIDLAYALRWVQLGDVRAAS